jgi:hypothetical protein
MDISDRFIPIPAESDNGDRRKFCTSGIALVESNPQRSIALVCHDNKSVMDRAGDAPRFGILTLDHLPMSMAYRRIEWPQEHLPDDLEGLTGFPIGGRKVFSRCRARAKSITLNSIKTQKSTTTPSVTGVF